jgi:hypothetical protein
MPITGQTRKQYNAELVEAAEEAAAFLMARTRSGAIMPLQPTLALLERAWLMGWNTARDRKHRDILTEAAKCSSTS